MSKVVMIFALAAAMLFCAPVSAKTGYAAPLKVVATIFPVYDFVRAVAGDRVTLSMLARPGSEVHSFDPSPQDILLIRNADVFIYIGGESDTWVKTLMKSSEPLDQTAVRLIEHVSAVKEETVEGMQTEEEEHGHEEEHEEDYDEHIWTSPRNAILMIGAIADALSAADPSNADEYRARADRYADEIRALGEEVKTLVGSAKRKTIVFGDRFPFRYFTDEFGLEYRAAFPGCHTQTDVSVATMAYLINFVKDGGIPAVYALELSNGNIARGIAQETGAEMLTLHSYHNVARADFDSGVTYADLMRRNLENLRKGLY
ncbi:MAG: metal ABC transporter substrate-binding protein [Synergistaceae bacterium]|nr:metal ABC transporter substrate-binding protein [Synergistaceae bacterium]